MRLKKESSVNKWDLKMLLIGVLFLKATPE